MAFALELGNVADGDGGEVLVLVGGGAEGGDAGAGAEDEGFGAAGCEAQEARVLELGPGGDDALPGMTSCYISTAYNEPSL